MLLHSAQYHLRHISPLKLFQFFPLEWTSGRIDIGSFACPSCKSRQLLLQVRWPPYLLRPSAMMEQQRRPQLQELQPELRPVPHLNQFSTVSSFLRRDIRKFVDGYDNWHAKFNSILNMLRHIIATSSNKGNVLRSIYIRYRQTRSDLDVS